ncbi:unnamed protein product [Adineta steineri]|nr:unnamed protein product [Adineta steineri]CAF1414284.1 unnamed protein product [Adineta steineri]CAF4048507.1 unnamed protein product [Adineta steineri]
MDHIFPDEVFVQIFRYTNKFDLFRGFYNLNSRLNRLVNQTRIYFHNELDEEHRQSILPYIHPQQIFSFHVNEQEFRYSKLNKCVNLRELEFHTRRGYTNITYDHPDLKHVKPSVFPHLRQLIIYVQTGSSRYPQLCKMIFGNEFPVLQSVHLPYANRGYESSIETWSTSLKYLTIGCCNKSAFYSLLENLPNLKYFECKFGINNGTGIKKPSLSLTGITLTTYDETPSGNRYRSNTSLETLIELYKYLPNLQHTLLFVSDSDSLERIADKLSRILSNCLKLKTFDCVITYYNECSISINDIKQRYPLFQNCEASTWKDGGGIGYRCRIVRRYN